MTDPVRLAKRVAEQFGCSRREAELYIEGGWVTVDGELVEAPFLKVGPQQRIELQPGATAKEIAPVTLLLHKPAELQIDSDNDGPAVRCRPASTGPMIRPHRTTAASPAAPYLAAAPGCRCQRPECAQPAA